MENVQGSQPDPMRIKSAWRSMCTALLMSPRPSAGECYLQAPSSLPFGPMSMLTWQKQAHIKTKSGVSIASHAQSQISTTWD